MAVERAANYVMESPRFSSNAASYEPAKRPVQQLIPSMESDYPQKGYAR